MSDETAVATPDTEKVKDAISTAIAICVAPEGADEAVQAIPPDRLLAFIYVCDELVRRLHAAKKGAIIEAQVAMEHGELPSVHLEVNGQTWRYQQDSKNEFSDLPGLFYYLNRVGASVTDLAGAIGYARVGDLQKVIATLPEDVQADAYATLEEHRVRKPTGWALVNTDSPYRKGRK